MNIKTILKNILFLGSAALALTLLVPPAGGATEVFSASLLGANAAPPINSTGAATFHMENDNGVITFTMTFSGLSSNLVVSHLHFAPTRVAGGVMIFLCGGGNQPACPAATSGTFSGTIVAANVTGPALQGITAGNLTAALEAVDEGFSYANIHTTNFQGGEIRGQVRRGNKHTDHGSGNDGDTHGHK